MTQHELIIEYIQTNGSIIPAKLNDKQRAIKGDWIGAEAGKRCREMRSRIQGQWRNPYGKQMLESRKDGRFEVFYLLGEAPEIEFTPHSIVTHTNTGLIEPYTVSVKKICCYSITQFSTHDRNCEKTKETTNQMRF